MPPEPEPRSRYATFALAAAPLALIALAALLVRFPPEQYGFYPRCPVYAYLHLECPGCGSTRALAALLGGHVLAALKLNALTTLLAPAALAYGAMCYVQLLRRRSIWLPQPSPRTLRAAFAVTLLFTVLRNL